MDDKNKTTDQGLICAFDLDMGGCVPAVIVGLCGHRSRGFAGLYKTGFFMACWNDSSWCHVSAHIG